MSYCSQQDLVDRLSATGLVYVADDDGDDSVSSSESSSLIDAALGAAFAEIDAALVTQIPLPLNEANEWLRYRAIDLAAERAIERKGQTVPPSLAEAARRTRSWLEMVRAGAMRVPALTYPSDTLDVDARRLGRPRIARPVKRKKGKD